VAEEEALELACDLEANGATQAGPGVSVFHETIPSANVSRLSEIFDTLGAEEP
jgi:hypothetical protein